ncbi:hypothetical protein [Nonomuraea lactucae]|uniref:hypothetical protein n=1 Tax=Nonomuraea lactucae TaxID=2249762 RepID=UPI000DE2DF4C|nr:hypothetical protein [Nonomuraea lactucae]
MTKFANVLTGAFAVTALVLGTGCSASADGGDAGGTRGDVASLAHKDGQSKKKESPGRAASGTDRPQIRLDTSEREKLDMYQPYLSCLKEHGVPVQKGGGGPAGNKPAPDPSKLYYPSVDVSKYPAAVKACDGKMPQQPPELDPKKNPRYLDDFRAWIKCMDGRGVKVDALPDGSGFNWREVTVSDAERDRIVDECEMEAFGGRD